MLLKYFKKNGYYFVLFLLINTLLMTSVGIVASRTDIDNLESYRRIIETEDIFLLDSQKHGKTYYESLFDSDLIDVGVCMDAYNPYVANQTISLTLTGVPIFFVEDQTFEGGCIMDYDTFIFNNSPTYITALNNDLRNGLTIQVNDTVFSEKPGIYFSKNDEVLEYIFYYAIVADENNIHRLYQYFDDYTDSSNNLVCYYGDLIDFRSEKIKWKKIEGQLSYIALGFVIVITFISLLIYLFYIKKNLKDYKLLYQVGESKYKISAFISSIIACSFLCSVPLSIACINLFISVHNSDLSNLVLLRFGENTAIIIVCSIVCHIANIAAVNIIGLQKIHKE